MSTLTRTISVAIVGVILSSNLAHADVVTDWNEKLVEIMLAEKSNPLVQSRNVAFVHVAVFEAVNSVARRFAPYDRYLQASPDTSLDAAAASAAHRALLALYPRQAKTLDEALAKSLAMVSSDRGRLEGIELGRQAAEAVIALRAADGSNATGSYVPTRDPGSWVPNPGMPALGPQWPGVKPWVLPSSAHFRPGPPPSLASAEFKRDYAEVMAIGGKASKARTAEQTTIARFWIPPGVPMWSPVARQLVISRGLSLAESARTFALLGLSAADAILACWDTKYAYKNFRPVTAIREGTGQRELPADPTWEPAVDTPPFPAYVSGHACFGGAALTVLESIFGSDNLGSIDIKSPSVANYQRSYRNLREIAAEASDARIWGGIHWRSDQTVGDELGRKVGSYVVARSLRTAN